MKIGSIIPVIKKFSLKKKLILFFVSILLLSLILSSIFNIFKKPGYSLGTVIKKDITETVSESGKIIVNGKIDVFSPTTGIIEEVFVINGQFVKEGEKLFTVKSTVTEQERQNAYSNYLTALSTLKSAQAELYNLQAVMFEKWYTFKELAESDDYETSEGAPKYMERSVPEFHIPEKEWLAAESEFKNQQNVIAQAQAQVNSTRLLYEATKNATVTSPLEGMISNLAVTAGKNVVINTVLAPTTPVLSVGNFTYTEVTLLISENNINKLKVGQKAIIKVDAVENRKYEGLVSRLDNIGTEVKNVIRYRAYITVLDSDENIKSGMSADVDIITKQINDALTVPNSAVKPYQGGKAVRIPGKKKNDIKYVRVQTGIRGDKETQIIKGLSEGQTIITALFNEETNQLGLFGF